MFARFILNCSLVTLKMENKNMSVLMIITLTKRHLYNFQVSI